ncbi:MAG: low molecular weight protein-tyrosine-phosphatase [Erysipelotrichaceae bacterium]|nr:low molecular weight protein-tyrosine-phosphatase [Erysipelotrichaceae bacterium]
MKQDTKVLFVCHGNICRSAMAEYMCRYKYPHIECASRAVSNEESGNDIYPPAKRCLERHHIPYGRHYARKISQSDYEYYDVIYVMDHSNMYYINRILDDKDHKIKMLCERDVEDPWYTGDFEGVYNQIDEALDKMDL